MADTESGDRAALLLISTFFHPAPDAESGDKIREQSSLAPDSGILYRKNHCSKIRRKKSSLFFQAQNHYFHLLSDKGNFTRVLDNANKASSKERKQTTPLTHFKFC